MQLAHSQIGVNLAFYPIALFLIGVELAIASRRRLRLHRSGDVICNLGTSLFDQILVGATNRLITFELYTLVFARARTHLAPAAVSTWVLAVVLVELVYYWRHRINHQCGFFWAAHAVHHQSEHYNLTVALRLPWASRAMGAVFNLPLALIGVPPLVFATVAAALNAYQFWIHTQLIGKLGPLEWFLMTPSQHRVHHAVNPGYVDRNYGGFSNVFDRLFGTFAEERAAPVYGVLQRLDSDNPVVAYVRPWQALARAVARAGSWRERLAVLFRPPGTPPGGGPRDLEGAFRALQGQRAAEPSLALEPPTAWWLGLQFLALAALTVWVLLRQGALSPLLQVAFACWAVAGLFAVGRGIDRRLRRRAARCQTI
jgi:alkylglycerol monooxygenase